MELNIDEIWYYNDGERQMIKGNWKLDIPVTVKAEEAKEYELDVSGNGCL